ncbi:uncharacterized protein ISCGN_004467 [Ixodes scapularis]
MKSLVGIDVSVTVSESYTRNVGKINNIPVQYSDFELLDYLKDAGVIAVQRQISYSRKEDGSMEQEPTESVLLQFPQDQPMPSRVFLGFTSHPVMEYFGIPTQCFRCQRHGHIARHCRGQQRCKVCAGPHSYKECMNKTNPKFDGECKEACQFDVMKALCSRRMEPGAACDELRGYCDVFRKCRPIDAEGALSRLQQIVFRGYGNALVTYWPLTLLATALGLLMMGLFIRVCTAHTPSNNPTLVLNKSFNESFLHPLDFLKDSFKPLPELS